MLTEGHSAQFETRLGSKSAVEGLLMDVTNIKEP